MDWTAYQNKVASQIAKWGADMILLVTTLASNATYNVSSDSFASATTASFSVKGLFTSRDDKDEMGRPIVIENAMVIIPAKDLPLINDNSRVRIVWSGRVLIPLGINTLQPGGEPLFYRVVLK